ncbi:MAG: phage tail protein [Salibacteraceae bacterium]
MTSLSETLFGGDYPPAGFYFKVSFAATAGMSDTSFLEVSGLTAEMNVEEVVEGGENRYTHRLPVAVRHPNLVLKRGIAPITSPLVIWCKAVLEADLALPVLAQPLVVQLLSETGMPLRAWTLANAYPVKWEVTGFHAQKNEVAIETIELAYNYSMRLL